MHLSGHLTEVQLARSSVAVNNTAVQVFARLLDGRAFNTTGVYKSVAVARLRGEPTISGFLTLHHRVHYAGGDAVALLEHAKAMQRTVHARLPVVMTLPLDATWWLYFCII